jgi:nucleoside-diphosphate-sugar epimerase
MSLRGVRVAVTGASGFCGSAVAVAAAEAGADVICLGRRPGPAGTHTRWDAARERPDLGGADAVIHLAAAVGDQVPRANVEADFRAVNVDGAARMLEAAGDRPVVWVSSASVYAPGAGGEPIREDHPTGGQSTVYGRSKAAGERLALAAGAVVLRPRAVYGPGDPYLLPRLRASVRRGRILLPGPDVHLSLTAVENLADACLAALHWPAGPYNVTDAEPYRRDGAVCAVLAAAGTPVRVVHVPVAVTRLAARLAEAVAHLRPDGQPVLSRYAIEQLAHGVLLDIGKARAQGWRPRRRLTDFLAVAAYTATARRGPGVL